MKVNQIYQKQFFGHGGRAGGFLFIIIFFIEKNIYILVFCLFIPSS